MKRSEVEITRQPFYELPLVRTTCRRCGKHSGWTDGEAVLLYWELMHDCLPARP